MKAIVTGGAGFIGSHLVDKLLSEGWEVLVIDNLSSGYINNVSSKAEFQWIDLSDESAFMQLPVEKVDAVFHLASHVGQEISFENPFYDLKTNALSTLILLNWCKKYKVKKFIFASSVNVYGNAVQMPITESTPISTPSPYAVGKFASENLCSIYGAMGIDTSILRLFNVYGPRQDISNLKQGMMSIYMAYVNNKEPVLVRGSLERFRDFNYVDDVVDAFYRCLDDKAAGKVYNVATGVKTVVDDLLKKIFYSFGYSDDYPVISGEPTTNDQFGFYGDSTLLQKDLNWKPRVDLDNGIKKMVDWIKNEYIPVRRI
jgi:UDP-glucose 4-epimerase